MVGVSGGDTSVMVVLPASSTNGNWDRSIPSQRSAILESTSTRGCDRRPGRGFVFFNKMYKKLCCMRMGTGGNTAVWCLV